MDTNWSRIWLDFRITIWFLTLTITIGLGFVLIQGVGIRASAFLEENSGFPKASGNKLSFLVTQTRGNVCHTEQRSQKMLEGWLGQHG
jgi:hypothetical protein